MGGRLEKDRMSAKKSSKNKHFKSIIYSSDGEYIICGGNSKYVCIYELRHR